MQCPLTTHYPLTTHCHDTLPDDALPPPPYLGDAMGRHIQTCLKSGIGFSWGGHLQPLVWNFMERPLAATHLQWCACEWLRVAASGCEWLRVAASGCEWLRCQKCMSGFLKKMGVAGKAVFCKSGICKLHMKDLWYLMLALALDIQDHVANRMPPTSSI